ncbi:hypothetical protein BC567DRAFT_226391 [Phyllosticta citribraziliensis]
MVETMQETSTSGFHLTNVQQLQFFQAGVKILRWLTKHHIGDTEKFWIASSQMVAINPEWHILRPTVLDIDPVVVCGIPKPDEIEVTPPVIEDSEFNGAFDSFQRIVKWQGSGVRPSLAVRLAPPKSSEIRSRFSNLFNACASIRPKTRQSSSSPGSFFKAGSGKVFSTYLRCLLRSLCQELAGNLVKCKYSTLLANRVLLKLTRSLACFHVRGPSMVVD